MPPLYTLQDTILHPSTPFIVCHTCHTLSCHVMLYHIMSCYITSCLVIIIIIIIISIRLIMSYLIMSFLLSCHRRLNTKERCEIYRERINEHLEALRKAQEAKERSERRSEAITTHSVNTLCQHTLSTLPLTHPINTPFTHHFRHLPTSFHTLTLSCTLLTSP